MFITYLTGFPFSYYNCYDKFWRNNQTLRLKIYEISEFKFFEQNMKIFKIFSNQHFAFIQKVILLKHTINLIVLLLFYYKFLFFFNCLLPLQKQARNKHIKCNIFLIVQIKYVYFKFVKY